MVIKKNCPVRFHYSIFIYGMGQFFFYFYFIDKTSRYCDTTNCNNIIRSLTVEKNPALLWVKRI